MSDTKTFLEAAKELQESLGIPNSVARNIIARKYPELYKAHKESLKK